MTGAGNKGTEGEDVRDRIFPLTAKKTRVDLTNFQTQLVPSAPGGRKSVIDKRHVEGAKT